MHHKLSDTGICDACDPKCGTCDPLTGECLTCFDP